MALKKKFSMKPILLVGIAILFWAIGAGSYHGLSAADRDTYKELKLFSDVLKLVQENYVDDVDSKKMIEDAIQGLVQGLDPHSSLLTPDEFKEMQIDTRGEFTGIGIQISMRDGLITVVAPIEGTPAYRIGVLSGDRIVKVNDETVRDLREAVKRIRGPKGTKVTITVLRKGEKDPIDFEITRDVIPIESVRSEVLQPGYGYVRVTNFRENTGRDLLNALKKLDTEATPLKGLVLDLRDNPGGLLSQAIDVSDLFLEKGLILSIKGRRARNTREFKARHDGFEKPYPIVVLINGGSASASEIVAGALQDQKRALILGTPSFGKGSVQNIERLADGYGLKLTIARYYTPSGRSIQAKGIQPDILVADRILPKPDDTKGNRRQFKEKDLRNHLDAEPGKNVETGKPGIKQNKSGTDGKKGADNKADDGPGSLTTAEKLRADNQVERALEILIGYNLFRKP
ncbi:MAG: peptidase S41 [Deltaproteobacteria bacterium]|nr:MAG: peptidase S41 [Deltaproteobacteria bacterium]